LPKIADLSQTYRYVALASGYLVLTSVCVTMVSYPASGSLIYNIFVSLLMVASIGVIYLHLNLFSKQCEHVEIESNSESNLAPSSDRSRSRRSTWKVDCHHKLRLAHYKKSRNWFIASLVLFALAFACYFTPKLLCDHYKHHRFLQFHAFWHILSAFGLFGIVNCITLFHHSDVCQQRPSTNGTERRGDGVVVGLGT
jgi:hypothetical protein